MKINDEHMYHGAALNQIAEDPHFTAINAFRTNGELSRASFIINDDIGIYLKYAGKPLGPFDEYKFTFHADHLAELDRLAGRCARVFLGLVCVQGDHICCLPYADLQHMVDLRRKNAGVDEEQYQILVVLPTRKSFRVYINPRGAKGRKMGERVVNRNEFPSCLFV